MRRVLHDHDAELSGACELIGEEQIAVLDARPAVAPAGGPVHGLERVQQIDERGVADGVEEQLMGPGGASERRLEHVRSASPRFEWPDQPGRSAYSPLRLILDSPNEIKTQRPRKFDHLRRARSQDLKTVVPKVVR